MADDTPGTGEAATPAPDSAPSVSQPPVSDHPVSDHPVSDHPVSEHPVSEHPDAGTTTPPTPGVDTPDGTNTGTADTGHSGPVEPAPTASPSVAAEIAPAQRTDGPAAEVDSVPAAPDSPVYRHGAFGARGSGDTSGFGGLLRRVPVSPTAAKPYGSWFDGADAALAAALPDYASAVERVVIHAGELTFHVAPEHLLSFLQVLRDDPSLRFELLSAVSGVHYPDDVDGRPLHSVYHLTSLTYRRRLRVEVSVTDEHPHVPSATSIYPTSDWQERETWDLMGIIYDGHPGLTRVFMPDDWVGHPQRKDYPLGGIPVEYKGASIPPPDERRVYQ